MSNLLALSYAAVALVTLRWAPVAPKDHAKPVGAALALLWPLTLPVVLLLYRRKVQLEVAAFRRELNAVRAQHGNVNARGSW